MKTNDFPIPFAAAELASARYQNRFVWGTRVVIIGSVITSALSVFPSHPVLTISQAILAFGVLAAAYYLYSRRPQSIWYSARVLAESIKTVSWRYVCKAEPFDGTDQEAKKRLSDQINLYREQNPHRDVLRVASPTAELITNRMREIRALPLPQRIASYRKDRIEDQLNWYTTKAKSNEGAGQLWYFGLIGASLLALAYPIVRMSLEGVPDLNFLFSIPVAILSWLQVKKFQELASSYSLAVHDIGLAKNNLPARPKVKEFSDFVGDMENAFSREHTQWSARKDVP